MTAPVLSLPLKVLRSATAGRRPGDGTYRALTDGEIFINTQDRVLCYLNAAGTLLTLPFDPAFFAALAPLASPTFTGALALAGNAGGNAAVTINKVASGIHAVVYGQMGGKNRWALSYGNDVAEAGANVGSDFALYRYDDSGNYVDGPLSVSRATGAVSITKSLSVGTTLSVAGSVTTGSGYYVNDRAGNGHSSVYYRSADTTRLWDSTYGDTIIYDTAGNVTIPGKLSTPTRAAGDNSTAVATTAYADRAVAAAQNLIGDQPVNLMLAASVTSNALTVSVLGANGLAPSATNPVLIPFRDNSRSAGDLVIVSITSPLSVTIPSGATLGTRNGVPCRIWIVAIASASGNAPSLGVQVCTDAATTIYPLIEGAGQAATAIGTGSTSAGVLYAPAAVSGGSTRIIGAVEFVAGQATAGTWATAPSAVLRHLSGGKRPGDTVQIVTAASGTPNNNNTNAYSPNGSFQGIAASITPTSAINAVRVRTSGGLLYNPGSNSSGLIRLTRGASGATLAEGGEYFFANGSSWGQYSGMQTTPSLEALDFPASASATSYGTQVKNADNSSNVVYPNGGLARIVIEELVA